MNTVVLAGLTSPTQFMLQVTCSFLVAVGLLFIVIELRSRFDRSFLYFGTSLVFLCAIVAVDIWALPNSASGEDSLTWIRAQHVLACAYIIFLNLNLMFLTRTHHPRFVRFALFISIIESTLMLTDWMLTVEDGKVVGGLFYKLFFAPYLLFYMGSAIYFMFKNLRTAPAPERKVLKFHLIGILALCVCGLVDMIHLIDPVNTLFHSAMTFGVLAYGIMASLIFTERFLMLLKERDATFTKLESAYRDLEQVNALKQIGESTAIINHEIKNYMFMISGNAQILEEMEHLSQKGKEIVRNIVTSVDRLTVFSDDILKLSRVQVTREKHPVNLTELVKGVVDKHYSDRRQAFEFHGLERDQFMFGDWGKLEQAFVNVFNNAFEAGRGSPVKVRVRITDAQSLLLVSVEDDGAGCDKEQLDNLFKAFYTTKKAQGGTGLGMSITRTIVESHGGKISAYSRNMGRNGEHGLKLIMTFPVYAQSLAEEAKRKHPIVLVKDGMDNLTGIIRIFQNVKVTPHIVQSAADIKDIDLPPEGLTVLVGARTMASAFTDLLPYPRLCLVSHHERNLYVLDYGRGNRPEVFSEEYIISRLLRRSQSRNRLRERQVHTLAA